MLDKKWQVSYVHIHMCNIYICICNHRVVEKGILSVDGRNHGALYLENFPSDNTNMERSLSENRVYPQDFI